MLLSTSILGDNISVTKGIVSRIALVRYSATARLLSIQIDAAINPGEQVCMNV